MIQHLLKFSVITFHLVVLPVKALVTIIPAQLLTQTPTRNPLNENNKSQVSTRQAPPKRSVVLPVYNESPTVWQPLAYELLNNGWDEVVLAIDQPDTETRDAIEEVNDLNMTFSVSESRRGKGGALHEALNSTTGDIIGFVDADGAISADELNRIYDAAEADESTVVIGSRDIGSATRDSQPLSRQLFGSVYRGLARYMTGVNVADFQCGAKAFNAEIWEETHHLLRERGFGFDTEFLAHANKKYAITEIGIEWEDPGGSTVSILSTVLEMSRTLLRVRRSVKTNQQSEHDDETQSIALVTAHPPVRGGLAEYGEKLAMEYHRRTDVSLTVISRVTDEPPSTDTSYPVVPTWSKDSLKSTVSLLRELANSKYDAIQFNIHMTYFGSTNLYRFIGLLIPPTLSVLLDTKIVVTMHDFLEIVEEENLDGDIGVLEVAGAKVATKLLLLSDVVTVTSEDYLEMLETEYGASNAEHIPHGTFVEESDTAPVKESDLDSEPFTVLLFGHLSPTKDVETAVRAFEQFYKQNPNAELIIAGGSHPEFPHYKENLEHQYANKPNITFTGYVPNTELAEVWGGASVALMPYHTMTGVSGVFQLAKSYGVPVVAADIDGIRTSTIETGGEAVFVEPKDPYGLAHVLGRLNEDPDFRRELANENKKAGMDVTMEDTADMMTAVLAD